MMRNQFRTPLLVIVLLVSLVACRGLAPPTTAAPAPAPPSPAASPAPVRIPPGITTGIAVFDRQAGSFTIRHNANKRFFSASLVKLLIALDYLWSRDSATIPDTERDRLSLMLRSSDDAAATHFYRLHGGTAIIGRMVGRLSLENTVPPATQVSAWGATQVSAADMVRVYRYILDEAPAPVRNYLMDNLRQSSRCGTDGFDQSFGIPSAFPGQPWSAKQGWHEFAGASSPGCASHRATSALTTNNIHPAAITADDAIDWNGEVLHTTGTVGEGDRTIVVVLTVQPDGTRFTKAARDITQLTQSLPLTNY